MRTDISSSEIAATSARQGREIKRNAGIRFGPIADSAIKCRFGSKKVFCSLGFGRGGGDRICYFLSPTKKTAQHRRPPFQLVPISVYISDTALQCNDLARSKVQAPGHAAAAD